MPTLLDRTNLPINLRFLCNHRKSASAVARATGINRQQFEKYLSGKTFPSGNVRQRLAQHFGVTIDALTSDPTELETTFQGQTAIPSETMYQLPRSNAQDLNILRNYIGTYQTFFLAPAWPDRILAGLVFVSEEDNRINTVFFNRSRDPDTQTLHRSRLEGSMVFRGERLFLMERSKDVDDRFSETILFPAHRHKGKYLTGMSFGVTWRPHRMPFATRTIWRRMHRSESVRTGMSNCGIYLPTARVIDPIIRNFFAGDMRAYTMN